MLKNSWEAEMVEEGAVMVLEKWRSGKGQKVVCNIKQKGNGLPFESKKEFMSFKYHPKSW